jgi:YidC/Oxa1 family membrane protein insertase
MQNRDQMHPQDMRNLILFAVISITMWLGYDQFIARPHAEAMRAAQQTAIAQATANAPAEILETAIVKPRGEIIDASERVSVENDHIKGSISLKGARLDDLQLKDYFKTVEKKDRVDLLSPARTAFPRYVESGWVASDKVDVPNANTIWKIKEGKSLTPQTPLVLTTTINGLTFERRIELDNDFGFTVEDKVSNQSGSKVTLHPYALVTEHGLPEDLGNRGVVHEGPIGYIDGSLEEFDYKDFKKRPEKIFSAETGWIGLTSKYWITALVPYADQGDTRFRFVSSRAVNDQTKDRYQTDITGSAKEVGAGETVSYKYHVFSGAKKVTLLDEYEDKWQAPHFDLTVDFGWFYFLTKPFFLALNFLYGLFGNFGLAIIAFTCVLRIFVFPLANISYKSFAKLRQVAPEMYEIRQEYKDDKQRLQQELVKLYQRNNVNPMAGCLPIVVQIPIFFALFKVLSNTIEMRHAPFYGWIQDLSAKDPTSIFNLFGLIPIDLPSFLVIGAWPCLMLIAMIVQKNISPPPEDPIQARIIGLMPWVMVFVMSGFASGLVIYWTVNNILAIIQQCVIMKSMGVPIHLFSKDKIEKKLEQEIKDGPDVHPGLEIAGEKLEEAVLGQEAKPVSAPKPKKKKKK